MSVLNWQSVCEVRRHHVLVVIIALAFSGVWASIGMAGATRVQHELEPIAPPANDLRLGHAPPEIAPVDQTYLVRFVRRVLDRAVHGERPYEPVYVPPELRILRCRVSVTLREEGRSAGTADSPALPVLEGARSAALEALARAGEEHAVTAARLDDMRIEIELIGPRERVGSGLDTAVQLSLSYEPAIHGVAVRSDGREVLVRPSQIISRESVCEYWGELLHECDRYEIAIQEFMEKLGMRREPPDRRPESVVFLRFRTTHLYEPEPGGEAVHLIGGLSLVAPEDVTWEGMRDVVDETAAYVRYRQTSDGIFSYEFLPGRDMYWPHAQNWIRQAATAWSLAVHAAEREDSASAAAAHRAIEAFGEMARPIAEAPRALFIATPDEQHALGTSALVALATIDVPDANRHAALREGLINGLVYMQRADGSFRTHFPPVTMESSQDYYPGEALLAITKQYVRTRDGRLREVCDRALPFYVNYFRRNPPPSFIPWQTQAWGQMARTTRLQKYADFVYEMTDALLPTQLPTPYPALPIYAGAFDVYYVGRAGISTAVYAEGLVEAVRTAEVMGDAARAARYREALRHSSRFVMQLQFREKEAYYVRSPQDVIGSARNTPINPTLRIDHCQHTLAALLGAMEVLTDTDAAQVRSEK